MLLSYFCHDIKWHRSEGNTVPLKMIRTRPTCSIFIYNFKRKHELLNQINVNLTTLTERI